MGLLKKIGKGFKKVYSGIGKVFKKVFKGLGKFLSSKWGKGLMIALSVFTMGTALMAGAAAWNSAAAGSSFLTKFVAASKGFIGALMGTGGAAKDAAGAGAGVGAEQAVQGAAQATGAVQELAGPAGEIAANVADPLTGIAKAANAGAGAGSGAVDVAGELGKTFANVGSQVSEGLRGFVPTSGRGNMLTKLLKGTGEFAKSKGGGQLIGSVLKGYAENKSIEEMENKRRKETRRFNRLWAESDIDTRPIFNIQTPTQGG